MRQLQRHLRVLGLFVLAISILSVSRLWAQVDTGSITGTVTDPSGAIIPGATVTLVNQGTGLKLTTVTNASGNYTFTPIRIGTYTVQASFKGFQQAVHKDVVVQVTQQVTVNFTLQPGAVTQVINVTAAPPLLQTGTASVGQVVNQRQVNNLPLNGRNYTFLAQLAAGVTVGQQESRGLNETGDFSANGTRPAQNNYLLDGMDDNADLVDFLNGTAYVVRPPVDAIQEFKVETSNYSAQFGRAGGAILNATVKSGTNQIHGDAWEFLRNSGLDAANFFENANNQPKGEYRQNQFGATLGGPIVIPHVYNGKNKTFFFIDYEGTRIRQATPFISTVPTALERSSGYTDFQELIPAQSGSQTDLLGRSFPLGTIFDPATTRAVTAGQVDPVTGLVATGNGFAREPFPNNIIPANRIDQNVVNLLNLFPQPNNPGVFNNFTSDPVVQDRIDQGDARIDHNFSDRDQLFGRVSFSNEPTYKPGPFQGIADGGAFNDGFQTAALNNDVLSWTHSVSPTLINEARIGFSRIGTSRVQPFANDLSNIPGKYGIQAIPQVPLNGGLPAFSFAGMSTLGSNAFLPSVEYNSTVQATENLTKVYGGHTFKGGFEFQHVKFSTLQPPWSRGQFDYNGSYSEVPTKTNGNTGIVDALLIPIPTTVPNGFDFVGGPDTVYASNIANTDDGKQYYGLYFQDDWKTTPKLTLNLGVRWDYFGQVYEMFGAQANFIPGAPGNGAKYLIPWQRCNRGDISQSFKNLTAKDGILVQCFGNQSLGNSQITNFSPRIGLAYQLKPKLVIRAGYGWFYDGFENRGYSPNIGENYPFQFQFHFNNPDPAHPITYSNGALATIENGFSAIPLTPLAVQANGLSLEGIQYNYITPYTMGYNFSIQYQLTANQTFQIAYIGNQTRHLEVFPGANLPAVVLPPGLNPQDYVPFTDFARGSSYAATEGNSQYNSLQTTYERRFSAGLNILADYTYSKCRTDARDLLNGDIGGYRAQYLPGFGIQGDYALCDFDVRNIVHFSGGYQLPIGKNQRYLRNAGGVANAILGGWTTNWILTLQDGQPFTVGCNISTTADYGCNALLVPGQNVIGGPHNVNHWMNPAAFTNPVPATQIGQSGFAFLGGAPTQLVGPGFHRLDFSLFKEFQTSESTHLEFRTEVFNITNTPNFSNPGFGGNGVVAAPGALDFSNLTNFGKITSTRDLALDQREIQFALKFYW
jgi:hypothetical protein